MARPGPFEVDTLIFGAGVAGMWLLDELLRAGRNALLLESVALGAGQTVASQGIIHGGLKYTLAGVMTGSAESIRDMPQVWRECLEGRRAPDLRAVQVRSEHCHLWRTDSLRSKVGLIGARAGLRSASEPVSHADRPEPLRDCPGVVARVPEQVIDCASLVAALAAPHAGRILKIDAKSGLEIDSPAPGRAGEVRLKSPDSAVAVALRPRHVVITAGAGAGPLREQFGLPASVMQLRPLHMVMIRGDLPDLFGHCVDGARTRVTITTARHSDRLAVWQVGGQVAEDGVAMPPREFIAHARRELLAALPGASFEHTEWSTYRVDRAEAATPGGRRPEGSTVDRAGDVVTAWPTKLALAPRLVEQIVAALGPAPPAGGRDELAAALRGWPAPTPAKAPWETAEHWWPDAEFAQQR